MKKLVNVAIMATLVIFATTAIFVGCKKEDNKIVTSEQKVTNIKDRKCLGNINFGELHNVALEAFYSHWQEDNQINSIEYFANYFDVDLNNLFEQHFIMERTLRQFDNIFHYLI